MSDETQPADMAEVLRLSTALAEQMLDAQAAHRPIPSHLPPVALHDVADASWA